MPPVSVIACCGRQSTEGSLYSATPKFLESFNQRSFTGEHLRKEVGKDNFCYFSKRDWLSHNHGSSTSVIASCYIREFWPRSNLTSYLRSNNQFHRDAAKNSQQNFGSRSDWGGTQCLFTHAKERWFLL